MYNRRVRNSQYCIQDSSGTVYFLADYSFGGYCSYCLESVYMVEGDSFFFVRITLIGGFAGCCY